MAHPIHVIPDIHGHLDKLDQALALIAATRGAQARIVFLGDLVDRGPDSAGVIRRVMEGIDAGRDWTVLRGNHDQLFLDFLDAARDGTPLSAEHRHWISYTMGGRETLASYGINADTETYLQKVVLHRVPTAHRDFLAELPLCLDTPELLFVHAGILPGVAIEEQDPRDLIWIREPFLSDPRDHGRLVVHGHTPVAHPEHHGNRVALDGGAAWGRDLHVAVFEGRDCWLLTGAGRTPLLPR